MAGSYNIDVPLRADGTPKAFFYDREGQHVIHRLPDGSMTALGFECRHTVKEATSE